MTTRLLWSSVLFLACLTSARSWNSELKLLPRTTCQDDLCVPGPNCNRYGCSECRPPLFEMDAQRTCRLASVVSCDDPRCLLCRPGNPGACTQCIEGYGLNSNGACRKCTDPWCALCGPPDKCHACKTSNYNDPTFDPGEFPVYRDSRGACRLCTAHPTWPDNCAACDSKGRACTACQPGYYLKKDSTCQPCSDRLCSSCPNDRCTKCFAKGRPTDLDSRAVEAQAPHGHYRPASAVYMNATTGVCTLHPGEADTCMIADSLNRCTRCRKGYHVRNGKCTKCKGGFGEDKNSECVACTNRGICTACGEGYGINTTDPLKSCVQCQDPFCNRCSKNYRQCTQCTACACSWDANEPCPRDQCDEQATRIYLSMRDSRCKKCTAQNCQDCNPDGSCRLCKTGFEKKSRRCVACKDDSLCVRCNAPYCNVCSADGTRCKECDPEQGGGRDRRCSRCVDVLCKVCSSRSNCTECVESTATGRSVYRNTRGQCKECTLKGCRSCSTDGTCQDCSAGFSRAPGGRSCIPCVDKLCGSCQSSPSVCDYCRDPLETGLFNYTDVYMSNTGVCTLCTKYLGCQVCAEGAEGDGRCAICWAGWKEVAGGCVKCPEEGCTYP